MLEVLVSVLLSEASAHLCKVLSKKKFGDGAAEMVVAGESGCFGGNTSKDFILDLQWQCLLS